MNLIEVCKNVDRSKAEFLDLYCLKDLLNNLGIPDYEILDEEKFNNQKEERIKKYPLGIWYSYDIAGHLGHYVYFYDDKFVAYSYLPYWSPYELSEQIKWIDTASAQKVKNYFLTFIKNVDVNLINKNDELDDGFTIHSNQNLLNLYKFAYYNDCLVEIIRVFGDRSLDTTLVKYISGDKDLIGYQRSVLTKELVFPWNTIENNKKFQKEKGDI